MTGVRVLCCVSAVLALTVATASAGELVGKPAPTFEMKGLDGQAHKLADLKGKIVVLEWGNKDCPVWLGAMSEMKTTRDKYVARKADGGKPEVVWLVVDSTNFMSPEDVRAFWKEHKLARPILDDRTGTVGKSFKARTTPHMFIIDSNGVVAYDGAIDNRRKGADHVNYVAQALDELLAGKKVSEPTTKPYGCSVKYKK